MEIVWTEPAEADLSEIFDYIARDTQVYAERFVDRIIEAVSKLIDHPHMGRLVPEAERDNVRELIYRGYRIIYLVQAETIFVLTIVHGSRDSTGLPLKPWDIV